MNTKAHRPRRWPKIASLEKQLAWLEARVVWNQDGMHRTVKLLGGYGGAMILAPDTAEQRAWAYRMRKKILLALAHNAIDPLTPYRG